MTEDRRVEEAEEQPAAAAREDPSADAGQQLPADPDAYDSPRGVQARARGLDAPYIPGGTDPEPDKGRREERRYLVLLLAMVVVIVLSGFVLGYLAQLLGFQT